MKPTDLKKYPFLDQTISEMETEVVRLKRVKNEIKFAMSNLVDPVDKRIFTSAINGHSNTEIAKAFDVNQTTISRRLQKICDSFSYIPFDVDGEVFKIRGYSRSRKRYGAFEEEFM